MYLPEVDLHSSLTLPKGCVTSTNSPAQPTDYVPTKVAHEWRRHPVYTFSTYVCLRSLHNIGTFESGELYLSFSNPNNSGKHEPLLDLEHGRTVRHATESR